MDSGAVVRRRHATASVVLLEADGFGIERVLPDITHVLLSSGVTP
jgi:hypothetical protein